MGVILFTGEPGSGKTYLMTKFALHKLDDMATVYGNYSIHWNKANFLKFTNFEFFKTIKKGLVLIDEIHIYFDARKWFDLPDWVKKKLNQHRHDGIDIYGTCQWFGQVDKAVRELTTEIIDCERVNFFGMKLIKTTTWKRKKTGLTSKFRPRKRRYHRISKKVYDRYNTMEIINEERNPVKEVIPRF